MAQVDGAEIPLQQRDRIAFYRSIFEAFDTDHNDFINVKELSDMLQSRGNSHDMPPHFVKKIHEMSDRNGDNRIDFDEFMAMIYNPTLKNHFGHYISVYTKMVVPRRPTRSQRDGGPEEQRMCKPPAVGMIIISIIEIIFFCVDESMKTEATKSDLGPISTALIYDPTERDEAWRFMTYMFVHIGVFHLVVNLLIQTLLGTFLEIEHKWWRVLIIYFSGVLSGSLGTSIADPTVRLAGASGGVYSLITAHIATIILNWNQLTFPFIQLLIFIVITGADLGTAIYNRYVSDINDNIGYVAHIAGAVAGLLVGLNVLRNIEVTKAETVIWWISFVLYFGLLAVAIVWNLAWPGYFPSGKDSI